MPRKTSSYVQAMGASLCQHQSECSGCPRMAQPYETQLSQKLARVRSALGRFDCLAAQLPEQILGAAETLGYRTRLKWMVGPDAAMGLFRQGADHEVVDLPGCKIAEPVLHSCAEQLRALRDDAVVGPLLLRLRAVDLRAVSAPPEAPGVLLTLVAVRGRISREEVQLVAERLAARCEALRGVALSEAAPDSVQALGKTPIVVWGQHQAWDQLGDTYVMASFGSFVQAHRPQAGRLAEHLKQLLGVDLSGKSGLELFAGSGALGLSLAKAGATLLCVESYGPAADRIGLSAKRSGADLTAHAADATEFVIEAAVRGQHFDFALVDPPRRGLSPELRRGLARLQVNQLVYVSCCPETAARDLAHLGELGFRVDQIDALDLMPHTDEVELVIALSFAPGQTEEAPRAPVRDVGPHQPARGRLLPPRAGSGLVLTGNPSRSGSTAERASYQALALVRGVTHKKGRLRGLASYHRRQVVQGHSLLVIDSQTTPERIANLLADLGHPVLGHGRCDDKTLHYWFDRHGLDRSAWHTFAIMTDHLVTSPIPADLQLVLESIGIDEARLEAVLAPR